ncbi:MAG: immunoglobulin domain-containing protein, partial [Verrucomicrobia bacterium]|nr:immunoglobulin domain-containing protein [Verrucomicrobiota bacterium]
MKLTYKGVLTAAALLTGVLSTPAAVTVQGWWHGGETGDYRADSSANNRPWRHGFSGCAGSGNPGGIITPNKGVGGPLGNTGYISTTSVYWLYQDCGTGGAWIPGNDAIDPHYGTTEGIYNPPATNYIIECWLLINPDVAGSGWFFASGSGDFSQPSRPAGAGGGGVYLMRNNDAGTVKIGAFVIGNAGQGVPADTQIGDYVNADSTRWMHVAIVNDGGTNTFYVNGVAHGAPQPLNTVPNGNIFLGSSPGTWNAFHGYLDELRISTFAPGAFAVSDLLLRPANPNILAQPQSVTIWDGGAAPFSVVAAFDTVSGYQWQKNGVNISGATAANVVIPQLFVADSGTSVRCLLTGPGGSSTSSNATATVVAQNPANVAAYQNLVKSEPSLLAYFPVDGDLGATLTNYKDPTRNGTLEGGASYDGRTNSAFGQRALGFNLNGDVTIPNNPAFEFSGGNGTIEALVYLSQAAPVDATIFAKANDYAGGLYYAFRMGSGGSTLNYVNDAGANLSWMTPGSLVGKFTHVALVIDHGTNVTAYANGYSLGTKTQTSFGSATGSPAWIGSSGLNDPGTNFWIGTIDELAVYGSALPADTIGIHASKFQSGTNEVPAVITGLPATGSKTLLAGGVASFTVQASGGAPMSYKWTKNGVAIPGATSRTLTLSPTALTDSGTYGVTVSNPYATTNSPTFDLIVVAPSDSYATMVMNAHPSAYWRLTETNGTVAADVAGGKDGTYQGSYALGSQALLGRNPANKSVRFNAPNANYGGKVEVPYSSVLNPPADQPFSVECFCYAYFNSNDSYGIMLSSWNAVPSSIRQGYVLSTGWGSINWDFAMFNGYNTARPTLHGGPNLLEPGLYYVAATWDGTNAYLYVNGTTTGPLVPAPYSPNPSASFVIGCRNDNGIAFDGVIGEVAFYNYALSANQLSNHWSGMFAPAVITTQPVGVTTNEGSTVTLTAAATGYPLTYQWFKDGVAIDGTTLNGDSTAHYPSGATGPTLVITQVSPTADAGSYWLQAYTPLPGGNATSTHVNVTVTADTTPPRVLGAAALGTPNTVAPYGPYLVKVWFNKRIDAYVGSYTIPGVTVISVSVPTEAGAAPVGGDWSEAIITTAGLTPGQT